MSGSGWSRVAACAALLAVPALASAWGWQAHKLVSELAVDRLPADVRALYEPVRNILLDSTVAPDKKVFTDPREGPKHFLNVEVFDAQYQAAWAKSPPPARPKAREDEVGPHTAPLQKATFEGRMPLSADDASKLFARMPADHGAFSRLLPQMQKEIGSVVYQPANYYTELVKAFRSRDAARIAGVTGYLSHYVGDLHVPLHNTIDHEGGFSGNRHIGKGVNSTVHSRFESGFVRYLTPTLTARVSQLMKAPVVMDPADITGRAMREAREAYALYPKVIAADLSTMAKFPGNRVQWKRFYATWQPTVAPIVSQQLSRAAQMLSDIILTAWAESRR